MTTEHKVICDRCGKKGFPELSGYYGFYSTLKGWSEIGKKDYCEKCTKDYKKHVEKFT